jgi:hypothetical protein
MMMLVVLGLIGVFWQTVSQRIGEIGLRRALGGARATRVDYTVVGGEAKYQR